MPPLPASGVPASVAVPSPLSTKVTPLGSGRSSLKLESGNPLVVTVKLPSVPTVNVVWSALVIVGAFVVRQREHLCGVRRHTIGGRDDERVDAAAADVRRARQRGRAVAVVHEGHAAGQRAALADAASAGKLGPVVTVKLPSVPTANVVLSALVIVVRLVIRQA